MTVQTKKFVISFSRRALKKGTFIENAKKHIVKGGKVARHLSRSIDKIVYGV